MKFLPPIIQQILSKRYESLLQNKKVPLNEGKIYDLLESAVSTLFAKGIEAFGEAAARKLMQQFSEKFIQQTLSKEGGKLTEQGVRELEKQIANSFNRYSSRGLKGDALVNAVENELTGSMRIGPRPESGQPATLPLPDAPPGSPPQTTRGSRCSSP